MGSDTDLVEKALLLCDATSLPCQGTCRFMIAGHKVRGAGVY